MIETSIEIISHRGNLEGPEPTFENKMETFQKAMDLGYSLELDIWHKDDGLYLGHDGPDTKTSFEELLKLTIGYPYQNVYVHCKTLETLQECVKEIPLGLFSCFVPFFHDVDDCIMLMNGVVWIHPHATKKSLHRPSHSILVCPDPIKNNYIDELPWNEYAGVCTDFPLLIQKKLEELEYSI
jgi:hypothetical protein